MTDETIYENGQVEENEEVVEDSQEYVEETTDTGEGEVRMSQQEFDQALERRLARERTQYEKRMAKLFGTKDLNTAAEYYKAGYAVAQAAGKRPGEILQRLQGQQTQAGQAYQQPQVNDPLYAEIQEVKNMMETQREQELREKESSSAKKEFGKLYDENQADIQDLAEERGLSLVDAAAIVLRPHLKKHYASQTQTKQAVERKRKVAVTGDAPLKGDADYESKLTPQMKKIARSSGMTPKQYYEMAIKTGLIEKD